jgi:hypothetical protein
LGICLASPLSHGRDGKSRGFYPRIPRLPPVTTER